MKRSPVAFAAVLAAVLLPASATAARADELSAWYGSDPRSSAYASIRDGLRGVFADGRQAQVPLWVLGEKLREGASKKVPANVLLQCIRAEELRLERAQRILSRVQTSGARVAAAGPGGRSTKAVGIYLRAGLPDPLVGDLLAAGAATPRGEDAGFSACETLVTLRSIAPIADSDSLVIGKLLIASSIEPPAYASLGPVFTRARSRGFADDRIVKDVIIGTLSSGGGAAAMNDKIEKSQPPSARVVKTSPKNALPAPSTTAAPAPAVVTAPVAQPSAMGIVVPHGNAAAGQPSGGPGTAAAGAGSSAGGAPASATMGKQRPSQP